jgi:hypothetical protein
MLVLGLLRTAVYRDWLFVCENTGAHMGYRQWFFGAHTRSWDQPTVVETFMDEHFPKDKEHRWALISVTGRSIFGARVFRERGKPGPIEGVSSKTLEKWFVALNDPEKRSFYDLLASGDQDAISRKLQTIYERPLGPANSSVN